jgi:uncharacterized membrane protein
MRSGASRDDDGGMSTTQTPATAADRPAPPTRPAPPAYLQWLREEVSDWQRSGLVDETTAGAILGRYHPARKVSLARLLLVLGAVFVGFGVIWLVASNLDQLHPTARFVAVCLFWVSATVGGELLAARREHGGPIPSPVVHATRVVGALLFGAVIFQAAQTLQVPAYEPRLVGLWALGALAHAYAVRSAGPLVIGVVAGYVWVIWQAAWSFDDVLEGLLAVAAVGVLGLAAAALHESRPSHERWQAFAAVWREVGAVALLGVLFTAALPFVESDGMGWPGVLVVLLAVAVVASSAAVVLGLRPGAAPWAWAEPVGGVAVTLVSLLLVAWEAGSDSSSVGAEDWAHAVLSVGVYLAVATGVAVVGILRDSGRMTFIALAALTVFTTVQAFAVFAAIIEGAVLFVVIGLILAGTGWLADRGRRQLARTLDETPETTGATGGAR